jgi:transcription initiation factor TFIIIB Brf1 subunit/transcription initiation factor TFIIB
MNDLIENYKLIDLTDSDLDNILLMNINLSENNNTSDDNICSFCKSDNLLIDNIKNNVICNDCGSIIKEYLNDTPDIISNEDNSSRYGPPSSFFFPKSSLGTKIVGNNRLSMLQRQGQMTYKEKSLMEEMTRIKEKCKKYNISQAIIDDAQIFYKKITDTVHNKGARKGKNIIMRCKKRISIIAACLFYASKKQSISSNENKIINESRTIKEIATIYNLDIKYVKRGCRRFCDIIDPETLFNNIKSSQPCDFIERNSKKLNIDPKYIEKAINVTKNISKLNIENFSISKHEPPSIAAGCILLIVNYYNLPLTKKDIAKAFDDLSEVTISKTYRVIYPFYRIILNNQITDLIIERINNDNMKKIN